MAGETPANPAKLVDVERLLRVAGWRRLVVTGLCLAAWRGLEQIAVPGLNGNVISDRLQLVNTSDLIHALGTGITFAPYSIVAIGITPYIYALIVVFLAHVISKRVRDIGSTPEGQLRLRRWTRALAAALALGQAYGWTVLLQSGGAFSAQMGWFPRLVIMLELTGGTMIVVFLADLIDEFGVGFGYGALLIFALGPVATEVHRMAGTFASTPSAEALYRPFGVWAAFSIGLVGATVAVLLAVRRVVLVPDNKGQHGKSVDLKLLMSGAIRPPLFAQAVMFMPAVLLDYVAASNPGLAGLANQWSPYGVNPWIDIAYVLLEVALVMGFAFFIVAVEFPSAQTPRLLKAHMNRLTLIGGSFLALAVGVVPVVERMASAAAGMTFSMSGFDAVLVVAVILAVVASLERSGATRSSLQVPATYMP